MVLEDDTRPLHSFSYTPFSCAVAYSSFTLLSGALTPIDQSARKFPLVLRKKSSVFGKAD